MVTMVGQARVLLVAVEVDGAVLVELGQRVLLVAVVAVLAERAFVEVVVLAGHLFLAPIQSTQAVFPAQYLTLFLILY
jgi:hypothetical protein